MEIKNRKKLPSTFQPGCTKIAAKSSGIRSHVSVAQKFNPRCDSCRQTNHSMGYWFESDVLNDYFRNTMAYLVQNVGENPRHVAWNNKNTEFDGWWQNMIASLLYLKLYEAVRLWLNWRIWASTTIFPILRFYLRLILLWRRCTDSTIFFDFAILP